MYKININAMPQEALRCFFKKELESPDALEKFAKKYQELMSKNGKIAASEGDLQGVIADMFGYKADGAEKGKASDKTAWLTTESKAFRVKAKGIVGEQTRVLEYVIQRLTSQQMLANNSQVPWNLVFFRME
jgi:hypothetical protein